MPRSKWPDWSVYRAHWGLILEAQVIRTPRAALAFGRQGSRAIALKVMAPASGEHAAASALAYYGGEGAVCCFDCFEDALLLERLVPGTPLTSVVLAGDDVRAMHILCALMRRLHAMADAVATGYPTVEQWGASLAGYRQQREHPALPFALVARAETMYRELCGSQQRRVLLHGDLHHDNVLFDTMRGWTAIDPKGVIGEPEYEVGALLRNPTSDTTRYAATPIVARRIAIAAATLGFDRRRLAAWCFAQAILSSVWAYEDGAAESAIARGVALAHASLPLL